MIDEKYIKALEYAYYRGLRDGEGTKKGDKRPDDANFQTLLKEIKRHLNKDTLF